MSWLTLGGPLFATPGGWRGGGQMGGLWGRAGRCGDGEEDEALDFDFAKNWYAISGRKNMCTGFVDVQVVKLNANAEMR